MTDLIKRDDALNLARLFHENYEQLAPQYGYKTRDDTKDFDPTTANGQLMIATCGAVLSALPAVPTHRYAGESEASVYDRKGFPPIEIVNDPAANREAALQALIEKLENSLAWYQKMDAMSSDHVVELTDKLEAAEAKLTKAVEALREIKSVECVHCTDYFHELADAVLAELKADQSATDFTTASK